MSTEADVTEIDEEKFFETGEVPEEKDGPAAEIIEQPVEKKPPEGFVPHGALHEERARRKELQSKLEQIEESNSKMSERFEQIMQRINQPKVDYDDDPFEAQNQQISEVQRQVEETNRTFQQYQQQIQTQAEQQALAAKAMASAQAYSLENPAFNEAYEFYKTQRLTALVNAGYNFTDAQTVVAQEEYNLVTKAYQDEVNPAERIYKIAVASGFSKEKPQQQAAQEKLDNIEKGQNGSKQLQGGAAPEELTLEALADMSDDDFDAAWEKQFGKSQGFM